MAKRIGKYKLTKRDSELSLADGGFASGALNFIQNNLLAKVVTKHS